MCGFGRGLLLYVDFFLAQYISEPAGDVHCLVTSNISTHPTQLYIYILKWVNTEWKQVEADRHELQNVPNF